MESKSPSPLALFIYGFIVAYGITRDVIENVARTQRPSLEKQLQLAVEEERYEDAARIRDLLIDINT